jgi:Rad3-related DNA helicase
MVATERIFTVMSLSQILTKEKNIKMTYELPHLLDREGQLEAMDWILNSNKKYLILRAPTGFGKSALAACASLGLRTLALVLHKSLQSANYRDVYYFDILYGKSNYPCLEKNKIIPVNFTAYDCGNPDCDCPYQRQELQCLMSQRLSLNYAKYLMSKKFVYQFQPQIMFCDEAHNLPNTIMDFTGLSLRWNNEFLNFKGRPFEAMRISYSEAMHYLNNASKAIQSNKPNQKKDLARWRKWKRLGQKVEMLGQLIGKREPQDWYFEIDREKLLIKPLTAKYHFKSMFDMANKIVLMSATITPNIAERLGINDDEFDYYKVPAIWPVPTRLVYDLGAPAMNWQSSEADKQKQAELITSVLRPDCSGIIHVMSKNEQYLREFLERLKTSLLDRIHQCPELGDIAFYIPNDGIGTDNQLQEWYKARQPGTYCISWNFHEGVDLGDDVINIMAKTPFASMAPGYERTRVNYDKLWYNEQTAMTMEQLFGRHQRGLDEHYLPDARLSYIADSSWHGIKTNLSDDFRMRIRNYNGRK